MKKIVLLICAFFCIVLSSCNQGVGSIHGREIKLYEPLVEYTEEYIGSSDNTSGANYQHVGDIRHFIYNDHMYIQFDIECSHCAVGIVHDPDCPCHCDKQ